LTDVLDTVELLAEMADCVKQGQVYLRELRYRISQVNDKSSVINRSDKPRVALLDWLDPIFDGGHWSPEIIELAGGIACFGNKREPSQRRSWNDLIQAKPDIIFIALCGFNVERSMQDVEDFFSSQEFSVLRDQVGSKVFLVDGNAYFSRPGPRLVDALEIMANAVHPLIHKLPSNLPVAIKLTS
jgi:iron complex transport system substrate-binding protein